jgi:hypothetical protein
VEGRRESGRIERGGGQRNGARKVEEGESVFDMKEEGYINGVGEIGNEKGEIGRERGRL